MDEQTRLVVWRGVGRATARVGGTYATSFLGERYTIPDAVWETFSEVLAVALGPGWTAVPGGAADPLSIVVQGRGQRGFLKSTRVTTRDGALRRLALEEE